MQNEVPLEEVKIYFLLADALKDKTRNHKLLGLKVLEEEYLRELNWLNSLNDERLSARITDKIKLGKYNSMTWYKGEKPLSDMGVWPLAKELDFILTNESPIQSAEIIKNLSPEARRKLISKKEDDRFESIRSLIDFVYPRFPLILLPGGTIREGYNLWAEEHDKPVCTKFLEFDINDGNSRAIAYALEGIQEAPVYFGVK